MKARLSLFVLFLANLFLFFFPTSHFLAYADPPYGTHKHGTIVCTEPNCPAIESGCGHDTIIVESGAAIISVDQEVAEWIAEASATGIDAGNGHDLVLNHGGINVDAMARAWADAPSTAADGTVAAKATATGIDAGEGHDLINNTGNIEVTASAVIDADTSNQSETITGGGKDKCKGKSGKRSAVEEITKAEATGVGINAGNGNDIITNAGIIAVNASSNLDASNESAGTSDAQTNPSKNRKNADKPSTPNKKKSGDAATPAVTAVGIDGGNGKDLICNDNALIVNATSSADAGSFTVSLDGSGKENLTTTVSASAVGIDSGNGKDTTVNTGTLTVTSHSQANAYDISVNLLDISRADVSLTSESAAVGIMGGNGKDIVNNSGTILTTASSDSRSTNFELNLVDAAVGDINTVANATAIGISGGHGKDELTNTGALTAKADSYGQVVGVNLTLYDFSIIPDQKGTAGSTATTITSSATGIDGGKANDIITNAGELNAIADSETHSVGVAVSAEGYPSGILSIFREDPLADASITTKATTLAIDSGDGNDQITNTGTITSKADATSHATSFSISFPLLDLVDWIPPESPPGTGIGLSIAETATAAQSSAIGIECGKGNDLVSNQGIMDISAKSLTIANSASVVLQNIFSGASSDSDDSGGIPEFITVALSLADASTNSTATAAGILGGDGHDTILNSGSMFVEADSQAFANSVAVVVQGSVEGLGIEAARTNTSSTATAEALGLDGGKGHNTIINEGLADVNAKALANSLSASVDVQGKVEHFGVGVALADASTTATASTIGVITEEDRLVNKSTGTLNAHADAEAYAESVSVQVQPSGAWVEIGGGLAFADTTASADAVGMKGGEGNEAFVNEGVTDVDADATANSLSASVVVQGKVKGVAAAAAFTETSTISSALATGISFGGGENSAVNSATGTLNAHSNAEAYAESISVAVQPKGTGVEIGGSIALSETKADSIATGMEAGDEKDTILNDGLTDVDADATANSLSASVTIQGSVKGVGAGVAFSNTTTSTTSIATGISAGNGDDSVNNSSSGTIKSYADSESYAESISVDVQGSGTGVVLGGAVSLSGTSANASASGVDAGEGENSVQNAGLVDVDADAITNSLAVSVDVQGSVTGLGAGVAFSDSSATADAAAIGISVTGHDQVSNSSTGTIKAYSDAQAYSEVFSVLVQGSGTGVVLGGGLSLADTTANAKSVGINAGDQENAVLNEGFTDADAEATANSLALSVSVQGSVTGVGAGVAFSDTSSTTTALSTGISTGKGNDEVINSTQATVKADAESDAYAESISVNVQGAGTGVVLGGTLGLSTTTANAGAVGIDAGEGDDSLRNDGFTDVDANSTANSLGVGIAVQGAVTGVGAQASLTDTTTTTTAFVTGISAGDGGDNVLNSATGKIDAHAESNAYAESVSLEITGATTGVTVGGALARSGTTAIAASKGIDGGQGADVLQNEGYIDVGSTLDTTTVSVSVSVKGVTEGVSAGVALTDASAKTKAIAVGIDGGSDNDQISNTGTVLANTDSTLHAVGVSVQTGGVPIGLSVGAALAKADTSAEAYATGIEGGMGNDEIANTGSIVAASTVNADSTSVAVSANLLSAAVTDATSMAAARATGISGGAGDDVLANSGAVGAISSSIGEAMTINITTVGVSPADAESIVSADAVAMDGSDGSDDIINTGALGVLSNATADAGGVSVTLTGASWVNADATAIATARGIDGGAAADQIHNEGDAILKSISTADASTVQVTITGYADSEASTAAKSDATWISGGEGDDEILDTGNVVVTSNATTKSRSVGVTLFGVAGADANATSDAAARGIDGGVGADIIVAENAATVTAISQTDASATNVSLAGYADSSASTTSKAGATWISGDDGDDEILNKAAVVVSSNATSKAGGVGVTLLGVAGANANSIAIATARGIDGGKGADIIVNESDLTVTATSNTDATATTVSIAGYSDSDANTTATAFAEGIYGDDGNDEILNTGVIDVSGITTAKAGATSVNLFGAAAADSGTTAIIDTTGVDSGKGDDVIRNEGVIRVDATAITNAKSASVNIFGTADSDGTTAAVVTATGINAGEGNNTTVNLGNVNVNSSATMTLHSSSFTLGGSATGKGSLAAVTEATGITGGSGDDSIYTEGEINVETKASLFSSGGTTAVFGSAESKATAGADTIAIGIDGGEGNDVIDSVSIIDVSSEATMLLSGSSFTFGGASAHEGTLTASTQSAGILGGSGADSIRSANAVTVQSSSYLTALGNASTIFGTAKTGATTTSETITVGIDSGDEDDLIENLSTVDVISNTTVYTNKSSYVFAGDATANATIRAKANSTGISSGSGSDMVSNEGDISVTAKSTITAVGGTSATFGDTETSGLAAAEATARGIDVGDGQDVITNSGSISVNVDVTADSDNDSDAGLFFYDAGTGSTSGASVYSRGITAEGGGDNIINDGEISVTVKSNVNSWSRSEGGDVAWFTGGDAVSTSISTFDSTVYGISTENGNNHIINNGTITVDADTTTEATALAVGGGFSTDGDGWGVAYASGNVEFIGILTGDGENWIKSNGQIAVIADTEVIATTDADGSTSGGSGDADAFAEAYNTNLAIGIKSGSGENYILNNGEVVVVALPTAVAFASGNGQVLDGDGRAGTWDRPISASATANAAGILTGDGTNEISNYGTIDVTASSSASVTGYSDSDTGGDAYSIVTSQATASAVGIQTGVGDNLIGNSGLLEVTANAFGKSYTWADRAMSGAAGDSYSATPAIASATGIATGSGSELVFIGNTGNLQITATAFSDTFAHGDRDSYAYANASGTARGVEIGHDNGFVLVDNLGSMHVTSSSTAFVQDDEPTMQARAEDKAYGINIGNSNSVVANSGTLDVRSKATAFFLSYNDRVAVTNSSSRAVGISIGDGINNVFNNGRIEVRATADNQPPTGYNYTRTWRGENKAIANAAGIETSTGNDVIALGADSEIIGRAEAHTISGGGFAQAEIRGIDAGEGVNYITNHGDINMQTVSTADVYVMNFLFEMSLPASAVSDAVGIKTGVNGDTIKNYGDIDVTAFASAFTTQNAGMYGAKTATAIGFGIDAGNGNNVVDNYGNISVAASAQAGTVGTADGLASAVTIGIKTGNGDDTIINYGNISTRYAKFQTPFSFSTGPGIAIDSGGGDDLVVLNDGSTTEGSVNLGSGNDGLAVVGSATVTGSVDAGSGVDALVLAGATNFDNTPLNFESVLVESSGTSTVSDLPMMERLEMRKGALQIRGNYEFSDNGTFEAQLFGDGSCARLQVEDTARLDGTLSIVRGPGAYLDGTRYTIFEAGNIDGKFSEVILPASTPLLGFSVLDEDNIYRVEANAASFTTVSTNKVESAVAEHLNNILPSATGDLSNVIGEFQVLLSSSEIHEAFSSLSPDSYDNGTITTFNIIQQYAKNMEQRMNNLRGSLTTPGIKSGTHSEYQPVVLAYNGPDSSIGPLLSARQQEQEQKKYGLWLQGFGQWGDQEQKDGYTGFDYRMAGLTMGFDSLLIDKLIAGLSIGHACSDIDLDNNQGDGDINSIGGSLYGTYFTDRAYLETVLSFARNNYENNRYISIGSLQRIAYSEHDGNAYSAYLASGYDFWAKEWKLQPFGSLQYIYLDEEGFQETGAGSLNLRVNDRQTESLVSQLGLRVARIFKGDSGRLIPELSAAWLHDFDIDDRPIIASFAGSPSATFTIEGQDIQKNGARLGAGITFIHKSGITTSLEYIGEFCRDYSAHGVIADLRFMF
jgi:uncharacterized protein YhjY with autotransporter beta-barrel domain